MTLPLPCPLISPRNGSSNAGAAPHRWHRPSAERDDVADHREHDLFAPFVVPTLDGRDQQPQRDSGEARRTGK
jgi:hypothetical protein